MKLRLISFCLIGAMLFSTCKQKPQEPPALLATVARAQAKDMPYVITSFGRGSAFANVDIKAQVDGQLIKSYFQDGDVVKKGDLLFEIDPRLYRASLEEALGMLTKAKSLLSYNQEKLKMYDKLIPDDFVSRLEYEQYLSNVAQAAGDVEQYRGAVDKARTNLSYCTIRAPVDGKAGKKNWDDGNIISANDQTPLTTIRTLSPMSVLFTIPEQYLPLIQQYQKEAEIVAIAYAEDKQWQGRLVFFDNTIDNRTGTILLRAEFPNKEQQMWSGQFFNIQLNVYTIPQAILVPKEAVKLNTQGYYVFVVHDDFTVEQRQVVTGQTFEEQIIISEGVKEGEIVVTENQIGLATGYKIRIRETS